MDMASKSADQHNEDTAHVSGQPCYLLKLPPEVRVMIWTLAVDDYVSNVKMPARIDLIKAEGAPRHPLLLTCRVIHSEAPDLYKDADIHYWSTGNFVIDGRKEKPGATRSQVKALDNDKLHHVTKLSIVGYNETCTFKDGVWRTFDSHYCGRMDCAHRAMVIAADIDPESETLVALSESVLASQVTEKEAIWYVELKEDSELGAAKEAAGWKVLTKREIRGMVRWYQQSSSIMFDRQTGRTWTENALQV